MLPRIDRSAASERPAVPSPGRPSWALATIVLFAAVLIAWGGSLANGFVWDDEWLVLTNQNLSLSRLPRLLVQPTSLAGEADQVAYYRPLLSLSLLADTLVWGRSAFGFHASSLLLHLGVGLMIFAVACRLLGESPLSGWAALLPSILFIVLPAHVEPVVYVSGRNDSLAALFALTAVFFYLDAGFPSALASAGFTTLALFTKESAALLPLVFILTDLLALPRRRIWPACALRWAAQITALGVFMAARAAVVGGSLHRVPTALSARELALTAPSASLFYIGSLLWPGLSTRHEAGIAPVGSPFDLRFAAGALTVGAVVSLAALLFRRHPTAGIGLAFAGVFGLAFPAIFPLLSSLEAPFPACERFLYLPAAGLALALAFPVRDLLEWTLSGPRRRWMATGAAMGAALLVWSACSESRAADWRSSLSLFETLARTSPASSKIHFSLGVEYQRQGRAQEAQEQYEEAVRLAPANAPARNNLGLLYEYSGRSAEAERQYRAALEVDPRQPLTRFNLASLLQRTQRRQEAVRQYREAIARNPLLVEAHVHLGETLAETGDPAGALTAYREAVRIDPSHGEAHARYGASLVASGRRDEGIAELKKGLQLDPSDDRVRNDLGAALTDAKRPDEGLALLDDSLARWPEDPKAHYHRGNALRALGRLEEAVAAFRKAIEMSSAYARAYKNLGVTLVELGRPEEALEAFDNLVKIEPTSAPAHSNRGIALRRLGRNREARAEFEQAVRLDPSFPEPARQLREMGFLPGGPDAPARPAAAVLSGAFNAARH